MKGIRLEFYKLRHQRLFLLVTLILLVEIIWAFTASSISIERNPANARWEPLLLLLATLNGLFFPILTAVCVSRICDLEHRGNTWKLLLTFSVKRSQLYAAKYICACIIMLWVSILQPLSIIAFGITKGFAQPVPILLLAQFLVGTALTNMVIIALQQWVSLAVKNQTFALSLGMIGGFIGTTAALFPSEVQRYFVWSYYAGLSPVKQYVVNEQVQFIVQDVRTLLPMMTMLVMAGIVIYWAGSIHTARQEV